MAYDRGQLCSVDDGFVVDVFLKMANDIFEFEL
jgi:hypothetical protein